MKSEHIGDADGILSGDGGKIYITVDRRENNLVALVDMPPIYAVHDPPACDVQADTVVRTTKIDIQRPDQLLLFFQFRIAVIGVVAGTPAIDGRFLVRQVEFIQRGCSFRIADGHEHKQFCGLSLKKGGGRGNRIEILHEMLADLHRVAVRFSESRQGCCHSGGTPNRKEIDRTGFILKIISFSQQFEQRAAGDPLS